MNDYLIIPNIKISGANAQSAYWVVSGPSPLAWLGFLRRIGIMLACDSPEFIQVAIVYHHLDMRGDWLSPASKSNKKLNKSNFFLFHPYQLQGNTLTVGKGSYKSDYVKNGFARSDQPVALCNIEATLIVEGMDGVDRKKLETVIRQLRVAGGTITHVNALLRCEWADILNTINSGFFIRERSDLLKNVPPDKRLDTLFDCLTETSQAHREWRVPVNLGYAAVTSPQLKSAQDGVRSGDHSESRGTSFLHAYGEPLVGLVDYVSKQHITPEKLENLFWGYGTYKNAYFAYQRKNQ